FIVRLPAVPVKPFTVMSLRLLNTTSPPAERLPAALSTIRCTLKNAGQIVALGDVTLHLLNALEFSGTLAASNTLSLTAQGDITNNGTLQGNSLVLSTGGVLTNNGQFTAGKGDSTFSAQRIVLNAAGSLSAGGDVVFNSLSDITVNGFTGTAGSLTMNAVGTLLNTALIYAANNM
ncbi:hypothetical protein EGM92_27830, partial [Enterobacter cloacae]